MTVQLDWKHCHPKPAWESLIHETLHELYSIKPITRARIAISQMEDGGHRFSTAVLLVMPGPDLHVQVWGQTFEEAWLKASASARKKLTERARRSNQTEFAPKGVKASFRG